MKKLFSLPSLYVLLWALYFTQGTIIPRGGIISLVVLGSFLLISGYFLYIANAKFRLNSYFKALNMFLLMFTVYGIHTLLIRDTNGLNYLKAIYLSLLPTYTFYVLKLKGKIDENWIRTVFFVMAGVVIVQYAAARMTLIETFGDDETKTINVGYEILSLLPLVLFFKEKPIVQYVLWAVALALILTTVKRGAIIIGALCTVYFIYHSLRNSTRKTRWYVWILVLLFFVIGIRYVANFYANSEYAQSRMELTMQGYSSNRDVLYAQAWNVYINSNMMGLLFGHGTLSTMRLIGNAAHNDWLELLVNQGLLGVALYLYYWLAFFKVYKRGGYPETKRILGMLLIIYFMSTLFSMSYISMTLPSNLALGYCLAKREVAE